MNIEIKARLHDIMKAIKEIDGFFADKSKMFLIVVHKCFSESRTALSFMEI